MEVKKKKDNNMKWFPLSLNQVLTLSISIAGFYYVVKGLNSTEQAVSKSTYLQTYGWTLEIDKLLVENSKLAPCFTDSVSKTPACVEDSVKVDAMAEYMLDNFDAVLNNTSYFEVYPDVGEKWKETVRYNFRHSAILREKFERESRLYGDTLRNVYYRAIQKVHDSVLR